MDMQRATWNVYEIGELDDNDKLAGIRNFFDMLHDEFLVFKRPLTHRGVGLSMGLSSWGGIRTPEYSLKCVTGKNSLQILENENIIYECRSKRKFDADEAFSRISYAGENFEKKRDNSCPDDKDDDPDSGPRM